MTESGGTEISPIMPENFEKKLYDYLTEVMKRKNEYDRRAYFKSVVMEGWFKISPRFIYFEKDRNDLKFATTMFETKVVVNDTKRNEAKEELTRYIKEKPAITRCVITDCVFFEVYTRDLSKPIIEFNMSVQNADESEQDYSRRVFWELRNMLHPEANNLSLDEDIIVPYLLMTIKDEKANIMKKPKPDNIKFDAWKSYVSKAFGTDSDATFELYVQDSLLYYATLILTGRSLGYRDRVEQILSGDPFTADNITNFIEQDNFFDFLDHNGNSIKNIDMEISRYNFSNNIKNEIFRLLYEELVSPSSRHQLGEFYTPPWLAKILVKDTVGINDVALDPSCGSGTFLREIIEQKAGKNPEDIIKEVIGLDINPIAVHVSRANYLSAMLELNYKPSIIPVFLADSLMPLEYSGSVKDVLSFYGNGYVEIDFNEIVPGAGNVNFYYNEKWDIKNMMEYINGLAKGKDPENLNLKLVDKIEKLKKQGKNHVWYYIIRNIYTPYYFLKKIDIVIGNPPWLTYKDVKNSGRQIFLDNLYKNYNMMAGSQNKTQQDLSAFFIVRCQEYLKDSPESRIAFVITRSIMNSTQYHGLRIKNLDIKTKKIQKFTKKNRSVTGWALNLSITKLWDLDLNPFHKPSCMILLEKNGKSDTINGYIVGPQRKASILEVPDDIKLCEKELYINTTENYSAISYEKVDTIKKHSPYRDKFKVGATIFPRPYFFIDIIKQGAVASSISTISTYGINANKRRRKGNYMFAWDGEYVPNDLIRDVILGEDISYFACTSTHKAFLPIRDGKFIFVKTIENGSVKYILRDVYSKEQFYIKTAEYLDKMEKDWEKHRGEKYQNLTDGNVKASRNMDISDRLNYGGALLSQKRTIEYIVVYNESGNDIRSCVLDTPVIVEHKAFYAYFSSKGEAYYVCGILNSEPLLNRLKILGILSERSIDKKPFEIFFPSYDKNNDLHQKISELTIKISDKAKSNESYEEDKIILNKYIEQLLIKNYD